jgi:succinate dehydrogenase / fumarate reductase flavoprotein subunit
LTSEDHAGRLHEAEQWCDEFQANNEKWLKSTIADWDHDAGQPVLSYEDVDTSLIPPRPRLYGMVGAEAIEEVWKQRAAAKRDPAEVA